MSSNYEDALDKLNSEIDKRLKENKNTDSEVKTGSSFPVFTLIAGLLFVAKLTAYPEISWWLIIGVWCIPLIILIAFFTFAIITAGCIFLMAFLFGGRS